MADVAVPRGVSSYDPDALVPEVGSRWIWEAGKPHAQVTIRVTDARWNGEEWWVCSVAEDVPPGPPRVGTWHGVEPGKPYWNDLGRFWEAVSPVPEAAMAKVPDPAEALAQAIQEEADDLGCNGDMLSMKLSEMLDQIGTRYRHLLGDKGHGT
jgi:hypothetical protein